MKWRNQWMILVLIIVALQYLACSQTTGTTTEPHPVEVEHIAGSDLNRVILTEKAIERIDLKTDQVRGTARQPVIPYSALIYDPQGTTWVYTSSKPRTFVRHKVEVDYIEGDKVYLSEGPAVGTTIASMAVAEVYGAEFEVGH